MTNNTIDHLGKRIASRLGEAELPTHVSARLVVAREAALARARRADRGTQVVSANSLGMSRLGAFARWASLAAVSLLASAFLVSENATYGLSDFDWAYHVQADSLEDLMTLFND